MAVKTLIQGWEGEMGSRTNCKKADSVYAENKKPQP
jgi:hypothetical protein